MSLHIRIKSIPSIIKSLINKLLSEFASFSTKTNQEWFAEMCFCLLTANSKAKTALAIEKELGVRGFCECVAGDIKKCIVKHKHRFHNNKTEYIMEAREYLNIKETLSDIVGNEGQEAGRQFLVKNIKGLGYKEASHFMRNVGYFDLAILDRHILRLMIEEGMINMPKSLTKKKYLEIEAKFRILAQMMDMSAAELDLSMWYLKTGKVLK